MAPDGPRFRSGSLFAFALMLLLGLASFGTFLNDEGAQLEAVHNLRQGNLDIEERAPQFYAIQDGILLSNWAVNSPGYSQFVKFAALPAYFVLKAVDVVLPVAVALLLAWSGATYVALRRGWSRAYDWKTGREWRWHSAPPVEGTRRERWMHRMRTMTVSHWTLAGGLALFTLTQMGQLSRVDYAVWGEVFAVQATHVLLSALGFVLFFRVVERETDSQRTAALASLAFLFGPVLFWGTGIKYHAPSVFLLVLALHLYQQDRPALRYGAFAVATVAILNTILAAPLLVALVLTEGVDLVRRLRAGDRRDLLRRVGFGVGTLSVAGGGFLAFNRVVWDNWFGRRGPRDEQLAQAGGLDGLTEYVWDWALRALRFEDLRTSFANVGRLFVDSRLIEGGPLAMLPMTPLIVLALASPFVVWRARRASRVYGACALHALVFLALFIHAAQGQGDGGDNRFFLTLVPTFLLLGAVALRDRVEGLERDDLWHAAKVFAIALPVVLVVLLAFGVSEVVFVEGEAIRQVTNAAWLIGTISWVALLGLELLGGRLEQWLGHRASRRWWATTLGVSFLAPVLWVFLMKVLVFRQLPPWPFGSGAETMSFLLPSLDEVRLWWGPKLIP